MRADDTTNLLDPIPEVLPARFIVGELHEPDTDDAGAKKAP
jgi:hypothetical protein